MVSRAVLSAGHGHARSGRRKCLQRGKVRERDYSSASSRCQASAAVSGDPSWVSSVIAGLHGVEPERLFTLLHLRKAGVDSAYRRNLRGLLFQRQTSLAFCDYGHVVCSTRPALCLLQRWKRVVDRSHRSEPSLLRLGFRRKHHRSERSAKR